MKPLVGDLLIGEGPVPVQIREQEGPALPQQADAEAGIRAASAGGFDSAGLGEASAFALTTYPMKRFGDLQAICL